MKKKVVMKFGGTSVGSVKALEASTNIILSQNKDWDQITVVVSAMSGVTNLLLKCAKNAKKGSKDDYEMLIEEIRQKHFTILTTFFNNDPTQTILVNEIDQLLEELSAICYSIGIMKEVTNRGLDIIVSFGERINARIFSALLRKKGLDSLPVEATELIVTTNQFQNASPLIEKSKKKIKKNLLPLFKENKIPIVTGFIGATENGTLTTLGRGGSDYSATILGACLDVDEVWTWTDVDGVMSADPRIIPNATVIPELSFIEVGEMAYFGAKVLHPKTIMPLIDKEIPLYVKNTFNPTYTGTKIIKKVSEYRAGKATAVSIINNLSIITVAGKGMLGVTGIAARTFSTVANSGSNVLMISQSSSEQSICFVIPEENTKCVIEALNNEFEKEIERQDISAIRRRDEISVLSVIGEGMRETPGVAGEIFTALGKNHINVILIAQGSSEYSISLALEKNQANLAMRKVHQKIMSNINNNDEEENIYE